MRDINTTNQNKIPKIYHFSYTNVGNTTSGNPVQWVFSKESQESNLSLASPVSSH